MSRKTVEFVPVDLGTVVKRWPALARSLSELANFSLQRALANPLNESLAQIRPRSGPLRGAGRDIRRNNVVDCHAEEIVQELVRDARLREMQYEAERDAAPADAMQDAANQELARIRPASGPLRDAGRELRLHSVPDCRSADIAPEPTPQARMEEFERQQELDAAPADAAAGAPVAGAKRSTRSRVKRNNPAGSGERP
jgi:hypothetical protein